MNFIYYTHVSWIDSNGLVVNIKKFERIFQKNTSFSLKMYTVQTLNFRSVEAWHSRWPESLSVCMSFYFSAEFHECPSAFSKFEKQNSRIFRKWNHSTKSIESSARMNIECVAIDLFNFFALFEAHFRSFSNTSEYVPLIWKIFQNHIQLIDLCDISKFSCSYDRTFVGIESRLKAFNSKTTKLNWKFLLTQFIFEWKLKEQKKKDKKLYGNNVSVRSELLYILTFYIVSNIIIKKNL